MGLETGTTIASLNASWPLGTDPKSQGDDHLRLIKEVMKSDCLSKAAGGIVQGVLGVYNAGGLTQLFVTADTGQNADLQFRNGGAINWFFRYDATTHGLALLANDSGSYVTTPLKFARSEDDWRIYLQEQVMFGNTGSFSSAGYGAAFNVRGYGASGSAWGSTWRAQNDASAFPLQFFNASGTNVGGIRTQASATTFNTTSDYRLKNVLGDVPDALARLLALPVCRFEFKTEPGRPWDGFIAHELAEHEPNAVSGEKDAVFEDGSIAPQSVDYSKLVPLLVAALQELAARVEALEA